MVFGRKKKQEEDYDEDEVDEEEEDEDEYDDDLDIPEPPRKRKPTPKLASKRRPVKNIENKYTIVEQPQLLGIKDNETDEIKEFNIANEIAEIKSMLYDIQQKV